MSQPTITIPAAYATAAAYAANLEAQVAHYTTLIDAAVAEGDDESAQGLSDAVDACCAKLDALTAAGLI